MMKTAPMPKGCTGCLAVFVILIVVSTIVGLVNPDFGKAKPDLRQFYSQGYMLGDGEAKVFLRMGRTMGYPADRAQIEPMAQRKAQEYRGGFPSEEAKAQWIAGFIDGFQASYDAETLQLRPSRRR